MAAQTRSEGFLEHDHESLDRAPKEEGTLLRATMTPTPGALRCLQDHISRR
jgi:hypothetical protein